jgi:hypothetical protein
MRRNVNISFDRVNGKTVVFSGGVNEGVTNLELRPGDLFRCTNYEEIDGSFHGYRSISGVERLDGKTSPSDVFAELINDTGNDQHTVFLLESEDADDGYDKSSKAYTVDTTGVEFDLTRSRIGEGSWKFSNTFPFITIDQSSNEIDFSADWTIELIHQRTNEDQAGVLFEKSGVVKISFDGLGNMVGEISTDGGATYNRSVSYFFTRDNAWNEMKFVKKGEEIFIMTNGVVKDTLDITAETITNNTNDITIGESTDYPMYIDTVRISNLARAVNDYAYVDDKLFSDPTFYVVNGDDRDREIARAAIDPVPGYGPVQAVGLYKGDAFAFRDDDATGVTGGMYRETAAGWDPLVPDAWEVDVYDCFIPDDTTVVVTGEAFTTDAGATGTVLDYVANGGDPTKGEAEGILQLMLSTGTLNVGDIITVTSTGDTATFGSMPFVPTFGGGDDVDFEVARFAYFPPNNPNSEVLYFLGNNDRIFAWDGSQVWNIQGPPDVIEKPTHVVKFGDRLFIAYADGSLFYSAVGDPSNFFGFWGAGEIKMGDTIVDLIEAPGSTLVIIMRNSTKLLTTVGEVGVYNFKVDEYSQSTGGYRNTSVQMLGDVYYCDDRGPTSLKATDAYGDFENLAIKKKANLTYQANKLLIVGAYVNRSKNQYRIMFNEPVGGTTKGISITFGDKQVKGVTTTLYPFEFVKFAEGEDAEGNVKILAGAKDGYVYRIDKGTSFDGEEINASFTSAYYHYATPRNWKRFHRILFEISAENKSQFFFKPYFNYSSTRMASTRQQAVQTVGQGGIWGTSKWGSFIWGGAVVSNPMIYLMGYGYNMAMSIKNSSKFNEPHTIHNMIVDYSNGSRVM